MDVHVNPIHVILASDLVQRCPGEALGNLCCMSFCLYLFSFTRQHLLLGGSAVYQTLESKFP